MTEVQPAPRSFASLFGGGNGPACTDGMSDGLSPAVFEAVTAAANEKRNGEAPADVEGSAHGGKGKGKDKGKGKRGNRRGGKGEWGGKGWGGDYGGWYHSNSWGPPEINSPFPASSFFGEWLDSLGNVVEVENGADRRGPFAVQMKKGLKEQVLSLRHDSSTGLWACGNAVLDASSSNESYFVWASHDGRRSVWRRKEEEDPASTETSVEPKTPQDGLPWLLASRRRTSSGISFVEEDGEDVGEDGPAPKNDVKADDPPNDGCIGFAGKDYDGGRVSAVLDIRQLLGADGKSQETLSYILIDHDLARRDGEDALVPAVDSPLWERLAETPRKNALQAVSRFYSAKQSCCPIEMVALDYSEVHVGRHRVPCVSSDVESLLRRWSGGPDSGARRASCMAHVFALYRAIENPLAAGMQRCSLQLSTPPAVRRNAGIEYEIFASPFNAVVPNGKFGSRWPHAEAYFGSAGSYPSVIDIIPEEAVVGCNPPFSDGYLEHVMNNTLERMLARFKQVHLVVPVRDAPWRSQLSRLQGAGFIREFWDATAMKQVSLGQPVMIWQGGQAQFAKS